LRPGQVAAAPADLRRSAHSDLPSLCLAVSFVPRPFGGRRTPLRALPTGPSRRRSVPVDHLRLRIHPERRSDVRPGSWRIRSTKLKPNHRWGCCIRRPTNAGIGISGNPGRL
jgi:hypothetical protein